MKGTAKEHIINVAMELFSKNGYQNTSADLIIQEAKVSKGLMFYHFQTKDGLLQEILSSAITKIDYILSDDDPTALPSDRFNRLIDSYLNSLQKDFNFWKLYSSLTLQGELKNKICVSVNGFNERYQKIIIDIFKSHYKEHFNINTLMEFEIIRRGVFYSYIAEKDSSQMPLYKKMMFRYLFH